MNTKEKYLIAIGVSICIAVFSYGFYVLYVRPPLITVKVYSVFEVTHTENSRGKFTNVYTVGQAQFFFRGDHPIERGKGYIFVYREHQRRWRDLTLISWEEWCPTCPE
jgi:hypothetical protein